MWLAGDPARPPAEYLREYARLAHETARVYALPIDLAAVVTRRFRRVFINGTALVSGVSRNS